MRLKGGLDGRPLCRKRGKGAVGTALFPLRAKCNLWERK